MGQKKLSIAETTKEQNDSIYRAINRNGGGSWLIVHRITGEINLKRLKETLLEIENSTAIFNKNYFRKQDRWLEICSNQKETPILELDFRGSTEGSTYELINNLRRHQYSPQISCQARFILVREEDCYLLIFTAAAWLIDRFCIGTLFRAISDTYNNNTMSQNIDINQTKLLKIEKEEAKKSSESLRFWRPLLANKQTVLNATKNISSKEETTYLENKLSQKALEAIRKTEQILDIPGHFIRYACIHLLLSKISGQPFIITYEPFRPQLGGRDDKGIGYNSRGKFFLSLTHGEQRVRDYLLDSWSLHQYSNNHSTINTTEIIQELQKNDPKLEQITNISLSTDYLTDIKFELNNCKIKLIEEYSYRTPTRDFSFKFKGDDKSILQIRVKNPQKLDFFKPLIPCLLNRIETLDRDLETLIVDLDWLDDKQKTEVLSLSDLTDKIDSDSHQDFITLVQQQADRYPNRLALNHKNISITYRQMMAGADTVSNQIKAHIKNHPHHSGQPLVGICLPRGCEAITALLGSLQAGAGYIPLDPTNPPERINNILNDAKPIAIITNKKTRKLINAIHNNSVIEILKHDEWIQSNKKKSITLNYNKNDIAYVIYTSGTTGKPKGVAIQRGNLSSFLASTKAITSSDEEQRWMQFASINFDASVLEFGSCLSQGASLMIAPSEIRSDPTAIMKFLERKKITHAFIPPAILRLLEKKSLKTLTDIYVGGEASDDNTIHFWSQVTRLWNVYGPTETTVCSSAHQMGKESSSKLLGRPLPGYGMLILDEKMRLVPKGVIGELWISGQAVSPGYLNRQTLTNQSFLRNPYGDGTIYRTRDLARQLPDGTIEYLGRNDFQIKIRGYRIELGEIEAEINDMKGISGSYVCVIGEGDDKSISAWFTSVQNGPNEEDLRKHLSKSLTHYMVPQYITKVEKFPTNISGKIDSKRLQMPTPGNQKTEHFLTPTEEKIQIIWSDILKIKPTNIDSKSNFFHIGGHSLSAAMTCHRINAELKKQITPKQFFEHPVLSDLAKLIETCGSQHQFPSISHQQRSEAQFQSGLIDLVLKRAVALSTDNAYTILLKVDFKNNVNPQQLRSSLKNLLNDDPVFSCYLEERDGKNLVVFDPKAQIKVDLHHNQSSQYRAKELSNTAFVPTKTPLFKAEIITSEDATCLLFCISHVIFDGWSMNLFMEELTKRYQSQNNKIEYHRSPWTMLDYGTWLAENPELREQSMQYWRKKLQGASCKTELPVAAGSRQSGRNDHLPIHIHRDVSQKLKILADGLNVTITPVLFAIYLIWIWRLTGQSELTIAYPYANRDILNSEKIKGMLVQMGFLRVTINPDENFSTLISFVAKQMIEDREHFIASPYDIDISSSGAPNLLFSMQSGIGMESTSGPIQFEAEEVPSETSKADLVTILYDTENRGITGRLEFDSSLLSKNNCIHFLECLTYLFESCSDKQHITIQDLSYLPESQRQIIDKLSDGGPADESTITLIQLLEESKSKFTNYIALTDGQSQLSYQELDRRTDQLAQYLLTINNTHQEKIGVIGLKSINIILVLFGILKAGKIYVPLDIQSPMERIKYMIEKASIKTIIVDIEGAALVDRLELKGIKIIKQKDLPASDSPIENALPKVDRRDLAYIIFTSGSTGQPKGVMIEHHSVPMMLKSASQLIGFCSGELMPVLGSLSFDASIIQIMLPLINGGTLLIPPAGIEQDPDKLHHYLEKNEIIHLISTPALIRQFPKRQLSKLKTMSFGGEAMDTETASYWSTHTKLHSLYGPTETTVMCSGGTIVPDTNPRHIGQPIAGYKISIRNALMQDVPLGAPGEIIIGGKGAARGYIRQLEKTQERFIIDPQADSPSERIYRSGDLGRFMENGNIEYLGRNDEQIKLRGYRIELGEIEHALLQSGGVRQAAAAIKGAEDQRMIVGYVVIKEEVVDIDQIQNECKNYLPSYMVPSTIVAIPSLPLTANGKLDRKALPDIRYSSDSAPPQEGLEQLIASIWEQLLHTTGIGRDDDFFKLGGNSLLTARLQSLLKEKCHLNISTSSIYARPTIRGMADHQTFSEKDKAIHDALVKLDLKKTDEPKRESAKQKASGPVVLLTGATGFLGLYLLSFLQIKCNTIHCICRAKNTELFKEQLSRMADKAGIKLELKKVNPLVGDLSAPFLGLPEHTFAVLANQVDCIVHCGAWVNHLNSYSTLKHTNVCSTIELIKLALKGERKTSICYVSTEGAGENLNGCHSVKESILDPEKYSPLHENGYILSKWVSEQLLAQAARDYQIDCLITRPGNITGDSHNGFSNYENNHFWAYVKGCLQMGVAPKTNERIEMTPVNLLAMAISELALQPYQGLHVANLRNHNDISWSDFFKIIQPYFKNSIQIIDSKKWQVSLNSIDESNALWRLKELYEGSSITSDTMVETERTWSQAALQKLNIKLDIEPKRLLDIYIPYLIDQKFI